MNPTNPAKQEFWKNHISRASELETGARAYCRENGLNHLQFYYWRAKFRREVARSTTEGLRPKFFEAKVSPSIQVQKCRAELPDAEWLGRFGPELIRGLSR